MKVGYDEQVFLAQNRGGISRYVVELIKAFQTMPELGVTPVPGWEWTPNAHAIEAGLSRRAGRRGASGTSALTQAVCYGANTFRRHQARQAEILHHTYTHPRFLTRGFRGLRVSTVYDMIPEIYPELFQGRDPHLSKRAYVAASDVVICISDSTRRDLIEIYGDPGVPMPVTYLGVGPQFRPGLPTLPGLPGRYVLFVGRRDGYKDFAVLAEAFASMPSDGTSLVVIGGGAFDADESRRLALLGIEDRVLRLDCSDDDLPKVYANALAFAFPSRHEGFGLPTLEAMAAGVPVVLPDTSSHPEVGGAVARYFPAGDSHALAAVLTELLGDPQLCTSLGQLGTERARLFSWQSTASATAAIYHDNLAPASSSFGVGEASD